MQNTTKLDLIKSVSNQTKVPAYDVRKIIEIFFDIIVEHLGKTNRIEIRGFGSIFMKKRRAKLVRNPKKPSDTKILPQRWSPVLRFSKEFKTAINRPLSSRVEKISDYFFIPVLRDFVDKEIDNTVAAVDTLIKEDAKNIVLDFNNVRYIYSPGFSGLVKINRMINDSGSKLFIVNIKSNILSKFESVKMDKVIPVFTSKKDFIAGKISSK